MRFTVWCPVDGAVEVATDDVMTVIVRAGSDVEVAFSCPVCGDPIAVRAQVPPSLAGLLGDVRADPGLPHSEAWVPLQAHPKRSTERIEVARASDRIEAYMEYFRRELADADTVETMLVFMDSGAGR